MPTPVPAAVAAVAVGLGLLGCVHVLLHRSRARRGLTSLGPADRITLVRAWLTCAVAALAVVAAGGAPPDGAAGGGVDGLATGLPSGVLPLVVLAVVALALDAVDGRVARRTGTATGFGARFDMEVDALLVLVLSAHVASHHGWAVLGLGLARYVLLVAGRVVPWLRGSVAPRRWRKVVAAVQGVVLVAAAANVLAPVLTTALLLAAAALLALSFGTEAWELWLVRDGRRAAAEVPPVRRVVGGVALATLVWFALAGPSTTEHLGAAALVTIPLDGVLVAAAVSLLGVRAGRWVLRVLGVVLAVVVLLRLLDLAFDEALGRPARPLTEWSYAGSATSLVADAAGPVVASLAVAGVVGLVAAVFAVLPRGLGRLAGPLASRRARVLPGAAVLAAAWGVAAVVGTSAGGVPVASSGAVGLVARHAVQARTDLAAQAVFDRGLRHDAWADAPTDRLLAGLRGKDVLLVFVESYGRVALDGPPEVTGPVGQALTATEARLSSLGWSSRSGWLASPTFGGTSWLAHSTLQTGLWVDGQGRYDSLLRSSRTSLSSAFGRAGWRTVADIPSDAGPWPEGQRFYRWDAVHDASDSGYRGPRLGYARVPDQYTLTTLGRQELGPGHSPVMAELDLDSSHVPWAPLPRLLPTDQLGDGSVYGTPQGQEGSRAATWASRDGVRSAYGRSVAYTWSSLAGFVADHAHDDLVLVVLGDHQPSAVVSGREASHDVPVSILARDPHVTARAAAWGWSEGLRPSPTAPVARMDSFRDRFLTTFTPARATDVVAAPAPAATR